MTVFVGTLRISMKEVKAPNVFDGEHGIALHTMKGNRASSQLYLGYMELFLIAVLTSGSL